MIRKMQNIDINRVADIWLKTNLKAHDFIPEQYWTSNYESVKEMMSQAEVYVYEDNKMIQDVDHCTVISSHVIDSPILGAITPRELSGGVKVLILMLKDDSFIYNMSGIIGFPTTIFVDNAGNIVGDPIVGSDIAATEEYIKSMNKE